MKARFSFSLALLCAAFSFVPLASAAEGDAVGSSEGGGLIQLWQAGQPAFGEFVRPEHGGAEASAQAGAGYTVQTGRKLAANPLPDFAFLSLEQRYDAQAARAVAEGLRSGGPNKDMTLLVRIPPLSEDGVEAARARVDELLALGANGVVIPHVLSAAEARIAVSFFEGRNVWSPANPEGDIIVMLIIEDPPVFDELEEIVTMPGYSSLVCGIGSLTAALDGDREAAEAINLQVLARTQQAGLPNLTTVSAESVTQRVEQGFLGLLAYGDINRTIGLGRAAAGR
jgi:2-keto-3-deoxy-L-rhamnonate aldolase RhmA